MQSVYAMHLYICDSNLSQKFILHMYAYYIVIE
jgi:hypothetical protein